MFVAGALVLAVGLEACASPNQAVPRQAATGALPAPAPPTLASAIKGAQHLGPASTAITVALSFGLRVRNPQRLATLIASGHTVISEQYSAEFGPDPAQVRIAVEALRRLGFQARWTPGSSLIAADGAAPLASHLLQVDIESYRLANGTTFYATLDQPRIPAPISAVADSVSGLDDYRRARTVAVRHGGLTPTDVLQVYNIKPLRDAGLDGSGQTIVTGTSWPWA